MNSAPSSPPGRSVRLLMLLCFLALAGVFSLTLSPLSSLAPQGVDPDAFRWLSLVQPAILAILCASLGSALAHRVGLDAPLGRALVEKQPLRPVLEKQLAPALIGGLLSGLAVIGYIRFTAGLAPARLELSLVSKLLYGGITEEIIARWGLMSLGVWIAVKITARGCQPKAIHYWIGNIVAAALFAVGHLPVLFAASTEVSTTLVAAVIVGNMLPGLMFGWLFQSRGLEAAFIAHATAHVVSVSYLSALCG